MRIIPIRLIGPIALMIAVQVLPQSVHKPNDVSSGDLDLQEAVIRYQVRSWHRMLICVMPQSVHKPNDLSSGDLDLQEAVIRYQVRSWQQEMHTYCVEINGTDPDPALLHRLRPLKVKGASACHRQNEKQLMMIVDDKKKASVIFNLVAFRKVSESEVEIEGGYFCGNLCMAQGTYHLVRGASGWHVVRFEARLTL